LINLHTLSDIQTKEPAKLSEQLGLGKCFLKEITFQLELPLEPYLLVPPPDDKRLSILPQELSPHGY
jgi:hypothetical protein